MTLITHESHMQDYNLQWFYQYSILKIYYVCIKA